MEMYPHESGTTCLMDEDIETCDIPSFILEPWRVLDRGFFIQICPEGGSLDDIIVDMYLTSNDMVAQRSKVEFPKHFIKDKSTGNDECFVTSTRGYKLLEIKSIEGKYF